MFLLYKEECKGMSHENLTRESRKDDSIRNESYLEGMLDSSILLVTSYEQIHQSGIPPER